MAIGTIEQNIMFRFGHPDYCSSPIGCNCDHTDIFWTKTPISTLIDPTTKKATYDKIQGWYVLENDARVIDYIIEQADPGLCLTSSIEYIRECKKWQLQNES